MVCATNAFGMGIDKDNVRLVLHADIPGSLENYLQEAGRAGRDLADAQCVLLYDEQDIETQFRLQAGSELNRRDIAQILRGLRRARRRADGEVVITTGELLRDEDVDTSFDAGDRQADTQVKSAISWLERSGFVERNHNNTRVFQGRPLVRNLSEARQRIGRLKLASATERRWLALLEAMLNADPKEALTTDQLAELPVFNEPDREPSGDGTRENGDSLRVLRTLHDMAAAGLIQTGVMLTAFVRPKGANASLRVLERVSVVERVLLDTLRELAPDAAPQEWLELSLRRVNQRLVDAGHTESRPQVLLNLLRSLSFDGRGLAGARGSLVLRPIGRDRHRVRLERDWDAVLATARRRQAVARAVLEAILARVPEGAGGGEILVDFSSDDLVQAVRHNIYLAAEVRDPLAAVDRALMFLHEQQAIILQQGLAVFRQAMTIRVLPQPPQRRYSQADYEPLRMHYQERVFQVHVMNEYARLGLEKIRQALELVLAYFSLDKTALVKRYFAGRKDLLTCATSQESYRRIVDELASTEQTQVVTAAVDENLLVLAGPGSGKTHVVVHRCGYLLRVKRVPARSILVVCFNRYAAIALRRRLHQLVGDDARGVLVQTYHGLAMHLTGTSFAELAERSRGEPPPFDRLVPDAIRLLRGETEVLGITPDDVRDRLLAGYRYILVDEYQDIDEDQYELISALAGRTESESDRKLAIVAVGDDDQNIYSFRGANVRFIRRFRDDYRARVAHSGGKLPIYGSHHRRCQPVHCQ